jgi:predicted lysophospholipase L1 biosynthesis ABC-type transport system permease subunit
VVGVVKDLRLERYDLEPEPTLYRPAIPTQVQDRPGTLILRTSVPYATLRKGIEQELNAVGAKRARPRVVHWDQRLYDTTAGHRTLMRYLVLFALVGLFLAALGLYGVLAFSVARRTREIGIRLAVGARPSDVFRLILGQGLVVAALGGLMGMVGALLGTRLLRSFLFGVTPEDPLTLIGVVILLGAVALLACYLPARRATKVDPMVALRSE